MIFSVTVPKSDVRRVIGRKRLPAKTFLHITGNVLYDLLKDKPQYKHYRLMEFTYSLHCRHASRTHARLYGDYRITRSPNYTFVRAIKES